MIISHSSTVDFLDAFFLGFIITVYFLCVFFFGGQECHSQEECLGRVLNAATKFASESCASERKACGEKIDFEPASWI